MDFCRFDRADKGDDRVAEGFFPYDSFFAAVFSSFSAKTEKMFRFTRGARTSCMYFRAIRSVKLTFAASQFAHSPHTSRLARNAA